MSRIRLTVAAILLTLMATGCKEPPAGVTPPRAPMSYPASMAALGDSITVGFASCLAPAACPRNSWATGTGTQVDSHYERIMKASPSIRGNAHNFAAPRATAADLASQAAAAADAGVEYVTVLIGANDVCRGRIEDMTDPKVFRQRIDAALDVLTQRLPNARVLVLSVPDVHRVWQAGYRNKAARKMWSVTGTCPALLANPTSFSEADTARRRAFSARTDAYNKQLAAACAAHGPHCRYDRGAVHRTGFSLKLLSPLDFFHPNASGQRLLARVTYPGRFTW